MDLRSPTPWLLGGVLVLAGVGAVHALGGGCKPTVKAGDRVLLFGDSLAVGLSTPIREIASGYGCDFQAIAKSGTRMADWLGSRRADLQAVIDSFRPTLVLVSLGTNDSVSNASEETLAGQVEAIASMVGSATLLWLRPPKLPFADRVGPIVASKGIAAFDASGLPIAQVDSIHPTARGYAGWAEHVWASMTCSAKPSQGLDGVTAPKTPSVPAFLKPARPGSKRPNPRLRHRKAWKV